MVETFTGVFTPFVNLVNALLVGLNSLLIPLGLDLTLVNIDFKLLSETSIFTLSLYDIVFYILLFLILIAFYKLLKFILSVPFNSIKKWGTKL